MRLDQTTRAHHDRASLEESSRFVTRPLFDPFTFKLTTTFPSYIRRMMTDDSHSFAPSSILYTYPSRPNLNCIHLASFVIIYYDHFVMFEDEVNYIWKHSKSVSSIAFLINRYFSFFANLFLLTITLAFEIAKPSEFWDTQKHVQVQSYREAILFSSQSIVIVLSFIRVYALYRRSRVIKGVFIFILFLGLIALVFTCLPLISLAKAMMSGEPSPLESVLFQAAPWEAAALSEFFIFLVLVAGTKAEHKFMGIKKQFILSPSGGQLPLMTLMWRDGAAFFGIMVIFNVANILSFYVTLEESYRGCLSTLVNAISLTLMSRLMLNLHTTSVEMRLLNRPSSHSYKLVQPNAAFVRSNVDVDVWDSKFTLTEDSAVYSFDVFDLSHDSRPLMLDTRKGLDIIEEEEDDDNEVEVEEEESLEN